MIVPKNALEELAGLSSFWFGLSPRKRRQQVPIFSPAFGAVLTGREEPSWCLAACLCAYHDRCRATRDGTEAQVTEKEMKSFETTTISVGEAIGSKARQVSWPAC
jgi:hypothetical protein